MRKFWYRFIYLILILIIVVCSIYLFYFWNSIAEAKKESDILNTIEVNTSKIENNSNDENKISESEERMLKIKKLKEINKDIVGWLEIEGTDISYPVVQGKNNSYYMTHNYKKEKSRNGSIFLDKSYDWNITSNNLLMYGHNLNNGKMFEDLLKYKNKDYYEKHKIIRFTTDKEDSEYEIMSAFKSRLYYKTEKNVFRYYQFINPKSKKQFNEYVKNSKKASLYDTGVKAKYGDELITLSTCSYHTEDGRFAVVGVKKVKKKEE